MANSPGNASPAAATGGETQFPGELPGDFEDVLAKVEMVPRRSVLGAFGAAWRRLTGGAASNEPEHTERHVAFDGFHGALYEEKLERDRRYGTVYNVAEERNAYLVRLELPRRLPKSALRTVWNLSDEMPDYDYSLALEDGVLSVRASVPGEAYRRLSYVSSSFPSQFLTRIQFDKPVVSFRHRLRDKVLEIIVFKGTNDTLGRAA
jgi:hypothetical protein